MKGKKFKIPGGTKGILYPPHPKGEQQLALVTMTNGTYPRQGYSVNDRCTETIYLLKGKLIVTINDKKTTLHPGKFVMILPSQRYTVRGTGTSLDIITPAWDKKQNHIIYGKASLRK